MQIKNVILSETKDLECKEMLRNEILRLRRRMTKEKRANAVRPYAPNHSIRVGRGLAPAVRTLWRAWKSAAMRKNIACVVALHEALAAGASLALPL